MQRSTLGVAKIKGEMLMTKEKDSQIIVRQFIKNRGYMTLPYLALFGLGCEKGNLLFALLTKFQYLYVEDKFVVPGSFCCTQAEIERKTGINPRKQTKLVKELQEDRLISCYYSNVGLRRLKWFCFTEDNFKNIEKKLNEAKIKLDEDKKREIQKATKAIEGAIDPTNNLAFMQEPDIA